jgi:LytS/YehU family sensor histidine kinase
MKMIGVRKIRSEALMLHTVFNLAVVALLFTGIRSYYAFMLQRTGLTIFCIAFLLLCIYTGRWLCQTWYLRHKPFHFGLYTVLTLMAIIIVWPLVAQKIFNSPGDIIEFSVTTLPFYIIAFVMGIIIKLTRASIQKQIQDAELRAEQKQSELNLLQSQLSPHFLFNTLNNMYGIAITQHEQVPPLLLKLSDLLRYSVYETKKPFVALHEELQYINNYIGFEKIRLSDRLVLHNDLDAGYDGNIKIAPMVLIVFIENAFKHAKNTLDEKIYVNIMLKISGDQILFCVENSHREPKQHNQHYQSSGLGLANTIKRLDLLYENDYQLQQTAAHNTYTVNLRLKIK